MVRKLTLKIREPGQDTHREQSFEVHGDGKIRILVVKYDPDTPDGPRSGHRAIQALSMSRHEGFSKQYGGSRLLALPYGSEFEVWEES